MRTPWLLCCLLVTATSPVLADLYKWTDSSGVVQYTAIPPAQGVPFEVIDKPPTPTVDPNAAMQQLRERANPEKPANSATNSNANANSNGKATDPNMTPERKELYSKNCESAKKNLQILAGQGEVVVTDPAGKKSVLNPGQREAQKAQAQKDIDYFCAQ